jgi:hypothetical protein
VFLCAAMCCQLLHCDYYVLLCGGDFDSWVYSANHHMSRFWVHCLTQDKKKKKKKKITTTFLFCPPSLQPCPAGRVLGSQLGRADGAACRAHRRAGSRGHDARRAAAGGPGARHALDRGDDVWRVWQQDDRGLPPVIDTSNEGGRGGWMGARNEQQT